MEDQDQVSASPPVSFNVTVSPMHDVPLLMAVTLSGIPGAIVTVAVSEQSIEDVIITLYVPGHKPVAIAEV